MIRKATAKDLQTVKSITQACAVAMNQQGIFQWNDHYPSWAVFQQDIADEALYVYESNGQVNGCIMLSPVKDHVYETVTWLTPDVNNLYIHRLAVHPNIQKKGLGGQLMAFAEQFALKNGYQSIRLDTFSKNPANQHFYEKRGFQKLGPIFFPKQSPHPFFCYEKIIIR